LLLQDVLRDYYVYDALTFEADVFISVGGQPITKLIVNNPSLAKWYLSFASDELVIAYNPKSHFAADLEKAKTGVVTCRSL
jgi:ABC-type molybdate transport system substrate-binding protein